MKKLVTAACALVAGIALAQVQSANTVGFVTTTSVAGFNWVAPAFATVGENTACFGDISLSGEDAAEYTDNIQILDENGNTTTMIYWTADGWFDMDGYISGDYVNDEPIVRGTSLIVNTDSAGVTIAVAGEVATNRLEFTSVAGFNWVGNAFPVNKTFGAIALSGENAAEYTDNIQLLDENGNTTTMIYWTADGWFDMDGYISGDYVNDEVLAAGLGLIVNTDAAGVTISVNGITL